MSEASMNIGHHEDSHDCQGDTNHLVHLLGLIDVAWLRAYGESLDADGGQVKVIIGLKSLNVLEVHIANLWLGVGRILGEDGVHWPAHDPADRSDGTSSAVLENVSVVILALNEPSHTLP